MISKVFFSVSQTVNDSVIICPLNNNSTFSSSIVRDLSDKNCDVKPIFYQL